MLNAIIIDRYIYNVIHFLSYNKSGSKGSEIRSNSNNPIVPIKSKQSLQPSLSLDSPSDSHLPSSESS